MDMGTPVSSPRLGLEPIAEIGQKMAAVVAGFAAASELLPMALLDAAGCATLLGLLERLQRKIAYTQLVITARADATQIHRLDPLLAHEIDLMVADPQCLANGEKQIPSEVLREGMAPQRNTQAFMQAHLHISAPEARRRLTGAKLLVAPDPHDMAIEVLPAASRYPILAQAAADGSADVGNLITVAGQLDSMQPRIEPRADAATLNTAIEETLVHEARTGEPKSCGKALRDWGSYLAENGTPLSDEEIRSKRGLFFRGLRDGNDEYLLRCDPLDSEVIRSFCEAWTNPRSHKSAPFSASTSPSTASPQNVRDSGWDEPRQPDACSVSGTPTFSPAGAPIPQWARATDAKSVPLSQLDCGLPPDGSGFESFADKDPRNTPQLWLDAIIAACSGALSGSDMSQTGGTKVKISVLIGYRSLLGQAEDAGLTAGGRAISAENIRRLACNADILPAVLGTEGEILNLGRESRGFSKAQRKSMAIRDRGCIYPGCTRTAATSEAHHVKSWLSGGETSVANSSTLCLYHHLQVHAGLITLQSIGGIPYVIAIAGQARGDPQRNLYWHPELRTAGYTQPMFD